MGETIGKKTMRSRMCFFQGVMARTVALKSAHKRASSFGHSASVVCIMERHILCLRLDRAQERLYFKPAPCPTQGSSSLRPRGSRPRGRFLILVQFSEGVKAAQDFLYLWIVLGSRRQLPAGIHHRRVVSSQYPADLAPRGCCKRPAHVGGNHSRTGYAVVTAI
jgi:hypothetical protein